MDRDEKLKLDYEQTIAYYHHLADSRFKLLALVPIVTGAAIGLLSEGTQPARISHWYPRICSNCRDSLSIISGIHRFLMQ